ncbi:MAG: ATP synthase subunit I [Candidatus Methylomirabilales bacterium]
MLGHRVRRIALILIGGGFLFCLVLGGWSWALGYAIGGGIGASHLELLRQGVTGTLASDRRKALPRLVAASLLRLLGIGILLYLVLKFLHVQVIALAIGLLVGPVAILGGGYPRRDDDDLGQETTKSD